MSVKLEPGNYRGTVAAATIYEAPSGAVMCRMQIEVEGHILGGGICLVQKDGTLSERGFKDISAIFGWTVWDWALWERAPEEFAGAAVDVVVETVQGDKSEFTSVKYINPPGGGAKALERGNAKAIAARYGAKVRALMGGSPVVPATAPKPPPPKPPVAKPPPPPPPPTAPADRSTMEECWDLFCKRHEGVPESDLYELWPPALAGVVGNAVGQNDLTPEDWGRVAKAFDAIPS